MSTLAARRALAPGESVIAVDAASLRPYCVLLQPMLGGSSSMLAVFDTEDWLLMPPGPGERVKLVRGTLHDMLRHAEFLGSERVKASLGTTKRGQSGRRNCSAKPKPRRGTARPSSRTLRRDHHMRTAKAPGTP